MQQKKPEFQLNAPQQAAVNFISGPLLVLAGAGSGKTRVITEKIQYLVEHCGYGAENIAAVTFTNKAAQEMKQRVSLSLGDAGKRVSVSTFHTLGLKIIRAHLENLGLKPGFTIYDAEDSLNLIKDLALQTRMKDSDMMQQCQQHISRWKSDFVSHVHAMELASTPDQQFAAVLYEHYDRSLRTFNAVDFDDLISLPAHLLEDNQAVREQWQNRLRYLLVDEYQDTNPGQYQLLRLLAGARAAFTVVGDDDQSIYTWRGARPENLEELQRDYPALEVIKLEQNYRSTSTILRAANHLIANNPHAFEKRLWCDLGIGDKISVQKRDSEQDEAEFVIGDIQQKIMQSRHGLGDFAILYRSNHQSRLLETLLQGDRMPYKISGSLSFFARHEIRDVMAYLRLLINPDDNAAFLRAVSAPKRGIGAQTLEKLALYSQERGASMLSCATEYGLSNTLGDRAREKLQQFADWLEGKRRFLQEEPVRALYEIVEDIDYQSWLLQNSNSEAQAERRWENVNFLLGMIEKDIRKARDASSGTAAESDDIDIEAIIGRLVLRDMLDEKDDESPKIQLMTLHAAKGLEFRCVYMVGVEEGILPHQNSLDEEEGADSLQEERRLAYVGITRAKQTLTCTYVKERKRFGEAKDCEPSRFLNELPADCIDWPAGVVMSAEEETAYGQQVLSDLQALFD